MTASHYIKSRQWKKAKQELLLMHLSSPNDMKILSKLGDVCKMIHQNNNAIQCYQRCINYDENNFVYYYKMAILYHDLNQLNDAKIYYEKSLSHLTPNKGKNQQKHQRNLYFHYVQLLMRIDLISNYETIKKYFDILLNKFNPKIKPSASLHFNYAKLLFNKYYRFQSN